MLWSAILTSESIDPPMSSYRSCAVILVYNWVGVISWLVVMWRLRKQHLQLNLTDLLKVFSALWHPQLKTSQMSLRQLIVLSLFNFILVNYSRFFIIDGLYMKCKVWRCFRLDFFPFYDDWLVMTTKAEVNHPRDRPNETFNSWDNNLGIPITSPLHFSNDPVI